MSRIKVYNTHTEITNGLFINTENKKHSIVKNDIQEVLQSVIGGADINRSSNREITLFISEQGMRQFNRAMQEEILTQFTDMSEQELIQYFDRISQEEEN